MASKKLSSDTSLANSYKLSRGVASVARPSAPTIGTATDTGVGLMSVTFTASTLGPTASSYTLTSSSGITGSGASSPLTLAETAVGTYTYSVSGVNANGTGPSSAASNSVNVASVFAPSGAYDSIATTTVGSGGVSSVTFSSIPTTYTHLQVRINAQSNRATYSLDDIKLKFNADTGSHGVHVLHGEGTAAEVNFITNNIGERALGTTVVGNFGAYIIDFLDYRNTSKYKVYKALAGTDSNGAVAGFAPMINQVSGLWQSTAAITDLTFTPVNGTLFTQYSSFALYGIKGA